MVDSSVTRVHAIVTGIVQGVNFRWFTQRRAADLGLVGYVRNRSDGSVEFVAEGARVALEQLLDAVRVGPASAAVENVDAQWSAPTGEYHRFEIRF
ncbi:MAG: acylphosphatase [Anaerolineales bacterium]|nr:acylphosphatase [Anaerolineales bacterium]